VSKSVVTALYVAGGVVAVVLAARAYTRYRAQNTPPAIAPSMGLSVLGWPKLSRSIGRAADNSNLAKVFSIGAIRNVPV